MQDLFSGPANVALKKPTAQISTLNRKYPASKAVNGITDGFLDFTHTRPSDDPKWWKVDLEGNYIIGRIELYNRLDPEFC